MWGRTTSSGPPRRQPSSYLLPLRSSQAFPKIVAIASFRRAVFLIGDHDAPSPIPVDNCGEAPQTAEHHDQFPFLRSQVIHVGPRGGLGDRYGPSVKKGSDLPISPGSADGPPADVRHLLRRPRLAGRPYSAGIGSIRLGSLFFTFSTRAGRPAYHRLRRKGRRLLLEWLGIGCEAAAPQIGATDPRSPAALGETQDALSRIVAGRSAGPDGSHSGTFSSAGIELGTGNVGSGAWRDPGGRRPWLELAPGAWWWMARPIFGTAPF